MKRRLGLTCGVIAAALAIGPARASAASEPAPMLIDKLPATGVWPRQRKVEPSEYKEEQRSFRNDVASYVKRRFRVIGDRMFLLRPDQGTVLRGPLYEMTGPSLFQNINSDIAFDGRPLVRGATDPAIRAPLGYTAITVGRTLAGPAIYTAIALYVMKDTDNELLGYFQLEPLIANPAKGL